MAEAITKGLGMRVLVLVSLCLNVAMGTFIATRWMEAHPSEAVSGSPRLVERAIQRLPTPDAEILRAVYRSKEAEFTASQRAYALALVAAARVLAQRDLDTAALRTAIEDARNKRVKIGDLAIDTFLEAVPQMSLDGRRALISNMRR
jgi:uncharacterized membrane protein